MNVYACYNKDLEIRIASSSGGIFTPIAQKVLHANGLIYGVAMTQDCYGAEYIRVDNEKDLALLRGSKYLQAKMGDVLQSVSEDLQSGRLVLFTGTACQINGLKKFLRQDYENLITVDVICHGAPSPLLWKKYAQYQEEKFGSKLARISFRCKDDSWTDFGMKENEVYISKDKDAFMQMFLRDYCLRPSCYKCMAKDDKMSDITMADFWGIDLCAPELNDGKGTSLVIVRTAKGEDFFADIKEQLRVKEVSYAVGVKCNPAEYRSAVKPVERDTFFVDMRAMSFEALARKYASPIKLSLLAKIKRKIKGILIKVLRRGKNSHDMNYGLLFTFTKRVS